jgi:TctA family transporter
VSYLGTAGEALLLALSWPHVVYPVVGTLLAMVTSFLPGIGGITLMALLLPLTLSWEPLPIVLLYGALVGGATFMGSVTAILFNVPGGAPSAATLLDGHPMAQQGKARTALACAAAASAIGSTIGVVLLVALLPVVRPLVLAFGPLEFLMLALWGLTTIIVVSRGSALKGAAMAGLGFALALVGLDPVAAQPRWTFGSDYLADGLKPIPVLLGLFAVAEALTLLASSRVGLGGSGISARAGSIREGILAPLRHRGLLLRSSLIGTLIGIIPGVGGTVASFVAYGHAVQSSRDRSRFGKGDIRGVVAPEAAHDAKDGGSLLPVLAFGLPGSEGTVLLLAVLTIHGIVPGRPMLEAHLPLTFALIWALFLSNWLTSIVGLAMTGGLARLSGLRTDIMAPVILALVALGAVAYRGQQMDLLVALAFGVAGYVLRRFGWPRIPFIIAFVLASMVEDNLLLSLRLAEIGRLSPWDRPLALGLAALVALTVAWMVYEKRRATLPEDPA